MHPNMSPLEGFGCGFCMSKAFGKLPFDEDDGNEDDVVGLGGDSSGVATVGGGEMVAGLDVGDRGVVTDTGGGEMVDLCGGGGDGLVIAGEMVDFGGNRGDEAGCGDGVVDGFGGEGGVGFGVA